MEWVEVRGETVDAAKEEALDQLGVAHDDAEFEIVQEPESRWMGLKRTEARVRARVRPTQPRPKRDARNNRRQRRGRGSGSDNGQRGQGQQRNDGGRSQGGGAQSKGRSQGGNQGGGRSRGRGGSGQNKGGDKPAPAPASEIDEQQTEAGREPAPAQNQRGGRKEKPVSESNEPMPQAEQESAVTDFLSGLAEGFGVEASVSTSMDDDIMIGSLEGDDLGLLVGPKGGTMQAIQELTRAAVQRRSEGRDVTRVMVDVAGYRERRRAALAAFAQTQADVVKAEGVELALEPMGSADRKAIHDAVIDIEGVRSISEGEEPRRRVVLLPDDE